MIAFLTSSSFIVVPIVVVLFFVMTKAACLSNDKNVSSYNWNQLDSTLTVTFFFLFMFKAMV